MKKISSIMLAAVMSAFFLIACGDSSSTADSKNSNSSSSSSAAETTTTTTSKAETTTTTTTAASSSKPDEQSSLTDEELQQKLDIANEKAEKIFNIIHEKALSIVKATYKDPPKIKTNGFVQSSSFKDSTNELEKALYEAQNGTVVDGNAGYFYIEYEHEHIGGNTRCYILWKESMDSDIVGSSPFKIKTIEESKKIAQEKKA